MHTRRGGPHQRVAGAGNRHLPRFTSSVRSAERAGFGKRPGYVANRVQPHPSRSSACGRDGGERRSQPGTAAPTSVAGTRSRCAKVSIDQERPASVAGVVQTEVRMHALERLSPSLRTSSASNPATGFGHRPSHAQSIAERGHDGLSGGVTALPVTANLLGILPVTAPHSGQSGRGAVKDWMISKRCPSRQRSS